MVDSAHYDIRLSIQKGVQGHFDAIHGCSRTSISTVCVGQFDLVHTNRMMNGDGMSHAALGLVGSHNYHFSQRGHGQYQRLNSFGVVTVVIGDQNQGSFFFLHVSKLIRISIIFAGINIAL